MRGAHVSRLAHTVLLGIERRQVIMMAGPCSCSASWLPAEQVRAGGLRCGRCHGDWIVNGRQLTLTDEVAAQVAEFMIAGGEVVLVQVLQQAVYIDPADVVVVPGRARIDQCWCGDGLDQGEPCLDCGGKGRLLYRACPQCGDTAMWQYVSGRAKMHCQGCEASWSADHPGWLAQQLPEDIPVAAGQ
jgi:hypothetical protein